MSRMFSAALAAAMVLTAAGPAFAKNPPRPPFREGKADFRDKELALTYTLGGPASLDFALLAPLSLGVTVDHVLQPRSWAYRTTLVLVDNADAGLSIAATAAATHVRETIAGQPDVLPVWGWQGGILTTLATESGLTFRLGIQAYDTEVAAEGGQSILLSPELAYKMGIAEVLVVPNWPLDQLKWDWVGVRIRL